MAQSLRRIQVTFRGSGERWGWQAIDLDTEEHFGSFMNLESKHAAELDALQKINEHVDPETISADELRARVAR